MAERLNAAEIKEFIQLKNKLFDGSSFMVFDEATLNSPEFKRYDELMRKKLAHLKYLEEKFGHLVK